MNVVANSLAKMFRLLVMEEGSELSIQQGLFYLLTEFTLSINGIKITFHYSHKIQSTIQRKKQWKNLQEKHDWSNNEWNSIDAKALTTVHLTLDAINRVSCSSISMAGLTLVNNRRQRLAQRLWKPTSDLGGRSPWRDTSKNMSFAACTQVHTKGDMNYCYQ
jgi:hypothetical protein